MRSSHLFSLYQSRHNTDGRNEGYTERVVVIVVQGPEYDGSDLEDIERVDNLHERMRSFNAMKADTYIYLFNEQRYSRFSLDINSVRTKQREALLLRALVETALDYRLAIPCRITPVPGGVLEVDQ
jgi:hypothetical protein